MEHLEGTFVMGCDLGQSQDHTAVSIVQLLGPSRQAEHRLVYFERFELGRSYTELIDRVQHLLGKVRLVVGYMDHRGRARHRAIAKCELVVDATGVGTAVTDEMDRRGLDPIRITIHGGEQVTHSGRSWRVPKYHLADVLAVLLEQGRLKITPALRDRDALDREFRAFRRTVKRETGRESLEAERGEHDDMVLATAIACWYAERVHGFNFKAASVPW